VGTVLSMDKYRHFWRTDRFPSIFEIGYLDAKHSM